MKRRENGIETLNLWRTVDCVLQMIQPGRTIRAASLAMFSASKAFHQACCCAVSCIHRSRSESSMAYAIKALAIDKVVRSWMLALEADCEKCRDSPQYHKSSYAHRSPLLSSLGCDVHNERDSGQFCQG